MLIDENQGSEQSMTTDGNQGTENQGTEIILRMSSRKSNERSNSR